MKAHHFTFTYVATLAFSLAAFSTAGCAEKEKSAEAALPPAKNVAATTPVPVAATTVVPVATTAIPDDTSARWTEIKDNSYDMRANFYVGLKRLEARVDEQISELNAKRATMGSNVDTREWDFAMKEMGEARSYLNSTDDEIRKATRETWDQLKDKVGLAWVRTQDACGKVKASTTT